MNSPAQELVLVDDHKLSYRFSQYFSPIDYSTHNAASHKHTFLHSDT